ncbi:MAG: DUF6371 domain-containing protein [Candidatus Cryptobacteroides sp.]
MYNLQKYKGIASRHTCPHCGRKRCFTLYVDENGTPLHETVGRCDHESSCGYHYTPKDYYHDHPWLKPEDDWRDSLPAQSPRPTKQLPPAAPKKLCLLPQDIVTRSVRHNRDSDLITFLRTILNPETIYTLIDRYRIGVTKTRDTIFFQIDAKGQVRTGKIMKYNPDTGHRIKDENTKGRITWVHSLMKQSGQLPPDWELTQCLFGEHLLTAEPDRPVALVESEKTAIICAGLMPRYTWLATGGKSQLSGEKLRVLKGRKVIAFPDVDGYEEWARKLTELPGLHITVSPILQYNATSEDREAHIDIADWLIRYLVNPPDSSIKQHSRAYLLAAKYISPEYHEQVEALINDLALDFLGAEKMYAP